MGGPSGRQDVTILQVNVGYACNMSCKHCHLSAGPGRSELMSSETMEEGPARGGKARDQNCRHHRRRAGVEPASRNLIAGARSAGAHVIVRTNLTVLLEPGMEDCRNSTGIRASRWWLRCRTLPVQASTGSAGAGTFVKSLALFGASTISDTGRGDGTRR